MKQNYKLWRWLAAAAMVSAGCTLSLRGNAQSLIAKANGSGLLATPPRAWVVDASANELRDLYHTNSYLRYRMHAVNEKGDRTRDIIESKDGSVARLLMRDGKPLSDEQDALERQRLNDMLASPAVFAKHVRNMESERKLADKLVPLMPDAMLFTYAPGQPQTGTAPGSTEVVIDYSPNPHFVPPDAEARALTGLEGRVWIDSKTRQVVRMEGTISHPVNFGWGMLAHIYPGGKLALEQTSVGGKRWIFTDFSMDLSARALMVKTLNVNSKVQASDFQTVPPMSYQDAIRLLLSAPLPGR